MTNSKFYLSIIGVLFATVIALAGNWGLSTAEAIRTHDARLLELDKAVVSINSKLTLIEHKLDRIIEYQRGQRTNTK